MEQDATDKILGAIAAVDKKVDDSNKANDERLARVEIELASHSEELREHGQELRENRAQFETHTKMLNDQALFLTNVSGAAARAVDLALEAKRDASRSVGEATQIVESAIRLHSASIGTTVQSAVKTELGPLVFNMRKLEKSDEVQTVAIEENTKSSQEIKTLVVGIAKSLGHPKLRLLLVVCACIGAAGGGAYSAFVAKQGVEAVLPPKSAPPR